MHAVRFMNPWANLFCAAMILYKVHALRFSCVQVITSLWGCARGESAASLMHAYLLIADQCFYEGGAVPQHYFGLSPGALDGGCCAGAAGIPRWFHIDFRW